MDTDQNPLSRLELITPSEIAALSLLVLLMVLLLFFSGWNMIFRGRKVSRVADRDEDAVASGRIKLRDAQQVTAPYISVISGLSGLTFTGTFVVIALFLSIINPERFNLFERVILFTVLGLSGSAAIIWLLALDQLTIMASSSIRRRMFFRFYGYVADLWFVGYTLIILALILFLLLVQPILAMVVQVVTFLVLIRYRQINNEWCMPLTTGDRASTTDPKP